MSSVACGLGGCGTVGSGVVRLFAVLLDAGPAGVVGLTGPGAGGLPTAAAILADVRQALRAGAAPRVPPAQPRALEEDDAPAPYYVALERCGAARQLVAALTDAGVGVDVITAPCADRAQAVTAPAPASRVRRALAGAAGRSVRIRVREELGADGGAKAPDGRDAGAVGPA
jgi:hypothetical protein